MVQAAIYGCEGQGLSRDERDFFHDADPWGFILFRRNCETAEQTRVLCAALRESVGREAPILVDHEGGRVSRLSPHIVPSRPPADRVGDVYRKAGQEAGSAAARLFGELLARDASSVGLNVNCVPMADVRQPDAHDIVGDRAFSEEPEAVAALSRAVMEGTLKGGCLPIIKHVPGHGRAMADSHLALPRVDASAGDLAAADFVPFRALNDAPLGMTAHIVYEAIDPDLPATLSARVIDEIIRGELGFDGLLMTDDLSMKALSGSFAERAARSIGAGCDLVLHCNGAMEEMTAVASGVSSLTERASARSERALAQLAEPAAVDMAALEASFAALVDTGAGA